MLDELITWLVETIWDLGYAGIVVLMAIESSVFPLPSEIVIPPAGVLVAQGRMSATLVILAGTVGSIIGALGNYALAVWLGRPLLHRYSKYFLVREASLNRAEAFFLRHGEIGTFVGRLLPVIRHLISLPAGIARMHLGRFVLYTGIGAAVWCAVLTWVGWYLGQHMAVLSNELFKKYSTNAVLVMLPVLAAIVAIYAWVRRNEKRAEGSESA